MRKLGMALIITLLTTGIIYKFSTPVVKPIQQVPNHGTTIEYIQWQYDISTKTPEFKHYNEVLMQLKEWEKEASDIVEVKSYGKTKNKTDLYYLRIKPKSNKPKVLITACIHGNEPLSTSTLMAFFGNLLYQYGREEEVTKLLDNRDIYFVPVVSPDSYPNSRSIEGVDPNRNFSTPNPSSPVGAIKNLFKEIQPDAVISGHTHGRVFLTPYGDNYQLCPNSDDYNRIIGEMVNLSGYGQKRACQVYGHPIYGSEVDWYYRNGAFSIVMEIGTHQRIPNRREIEEEFNRTFKAVLHFIKEAPLVDLINTDNL